MDVNVLRRVVNGLGANVYAQIVTVIIQLVGVPILLYAWGVRLYGEWLILFAIPAYLSMSDLGFSQSAGNDMTARVAHGDRAGALAVFQSLAGLVYTITGIGAVLITVLLWGLPLQNWLQLEMMDFEQVRWVLWLLAAEVLVRLLNGVSHAGFRASGDYALHIGLDGTTRLIQFSGIWVAALAGGGPVAAAAAFFGVRLVSTPVLAALLMHRHRWLHFGLRRAQRHELRRLFKPAIANMAMPLAQALNIQGMVLVVGATLGPLAVVVFSTLRTLTRLAFQLVVAVSHAAEPELATCHGAGNRALMQTLFIHALRAGLWLALAAAAGLAMFGSDILMLWTDGQVAMNPTLFAWLLGSAVASVLWYGALTMLKATNRHLQAAIVYVVSSAAAVAIAGLLLVWTGSLASAGLSLLVMDAIMAFYTLRGVAQLTAVRPGRSLAQAANPLPLLSLATKKIHAH